MTLSVAFHNRPWNEHTIGQYRACHAIIGLWQHAQGLTMLGRHSIIALGQHTWSDDIDIACHHRLWTTDTKGMSSMACHHHPCVAHTIGRRWVFRWHHFPWAALKIGLLQAWHSIISFGQHTRTNDIGHGMNHHPWTKHTVERCRTRHASIVLGQKTRSNDVGCYMPSLPFGSSHVRSTSGVACHNLIWTTHTVVRCQACNVIIPLYNTHERTTSGMRCNHHPLTAYTMDDTGRDMTTWPLGWTHSRTTSVWIDIISFGQHTRLDDVGHNMPSSPLGSTHGQTTSSVA